MNFLRTMISAAALTAALAAPAFAATKADAVVQTYANVAEAIYSDSLAKAKELQTAVDAFLAAPTEDNLKAARTAWKAARVPYQQSEGYRFGNSIVDDWEGRVNAWPLDEGLIDYVDGTSYGTSDENPAYSANVIANTKIQVGKDAIDATTINKDLIKSLQEVGGVEFERRDRLSRDRIPALGPGPQRHRAGRGRPQGDRFRHQGLHQRQLRPPRRVSEIGDRSPGRRSRRDGRVLGQGRRRA